MRDAARGGPWDAEKNSRFSSLGPSRPPLPRRRLNFTSCRFCVTGAKVLASAGLGLGDRCGELTHGAGKDSRIGVSLTRWGNVAAAGLRRAFAGRAQELGVEAFGGGSGTSANGCGVA